jgi:uncharacterized phage protein gp47/JayE
MTTFGIDDSGFTLKRLADILNDMIVAIYQVTDPVSGENLTPDLTNENDPLVNIVNATGAELSAAWETLQLAYNQFDPLKATGAGLSGLVQLNNLRRKLGSYATVVLTLTGTANATIAAGKQITDMNNSSIWALPEFSFDNNGSASVTGTCTVKGAALALAGSLVKILTPTSGITSVTNPDDSTGGSSDETDAELRTRQQSGTSGTAKSVIDSFYATLSGIQGVTNVKIFQNRTLSINEHYMPAKSIAVVIVGGADSLISQAIWTYSPFGLVTYGTTTTYQTDTNGVVYPILFSRPQEVPIFVSVEIEIVDTNLFGTEGETNIKESIVAWATQGASGVGIDSGYDQDGYVPGEAVYAGDLYTPVNRQQGIRIKNIQVDTQNPTDNTQVIISWNEVAVFSSARIYITDEGSR